MSFTLARAVLFTGRLWLAYVRVFVLFVLPYCTMLWGWWDDLPWFIHLPFLAVWGYGLVWAIKNSQPFPRWPSTFEARRALEQQRHLKHRPVTRQVDFPVHPLNDAQQALWHRAMTWAQTFQPRLLRPEVERANDDRFGLRFVALLALLVTVAGLGQSSALNNLLPLHKLPGVGGGQPQVEVWVTPPFYANQPAVRWQSGQSKLFAIPGSTVVVRLPAEGQTWLTPNLKMAGHRTPLVWKNGVYEGQGPVTHSTKVMVRLGWWPVFYGKLSVLTDALPVASLAPPIKVNPNGVMNLAYTASDDYGVQQIAFRIYDVESPRDFVDMPLHLPRVGEKTVAASDSLDLTLNPLAGFEVKIAVVATDMAGQESASELLPMVLPERKFYHPVAQKLVAARRQLREGARLGIILHALDPLLAAPQAFGDDVRAFLSMAVARAALVENATGARKRGVGLLWDAAVRVEDGPMKTLVQNVMLAQEALSQAIASGQNTATLQALFERLQQSMFELLSRVKFGNEAMPNSLNNNDLANLLHEIESLITTGATTQAQARLQQLKKLMANLQATGDAAALKALMQSVQNMQHILEQQQQLIDKVFDGPAPQKASRPQENLAKEAEALQKKLAAQGLDVPELTHAATMMRAASGAVQAKDLALAKSFQTKAYQALQKAQKALEAGLQKMLGQEGTPLMRDPSGRPYGPQDAVDVEGKNPATLSRRIRDQLFNRAGEANRPEAEKSYFRRLLDSF